MQDHYHLYGITREECPKCQRGEPFVLDREPCIFCDGRPHDKRSSHFARSAQSGNVALTVPIVLLVVLPAAIFVASVLSDVAEVLGR